MADEHLMTTRRSASSPMFEVIDATEASKRMRSVRLEATLEQYREQLEAGLEAVQQGKRFHVRPPAQNEAEERTLKVTIKRVARGTFNMNVRFDRAREGFIVRLATEEERRRAIERGKALTAAREARQNTQRNVAQSIMAQPASPVGVETADNPRDAGATRALGDQQDRQQQQTLSPGAEEGVPDPTESAAVSGAAPTRKKPSAPRRKRR